MLLLVLFRVPSSARAITSIEGLPADAVQPIDVNAARTELLPLLPPGTRWLEGSGDAEWEGDDGNRLEVEVSEGSLGLRAGCYRGELLAALRRIHATDRWIITSTETAELFDFAHPEVN